MYQVVEYQQLRLRGTGLETQQVRFRQRNAVALEGEAGLAISSSRHHIDSTPPLANIIFRCVSYFFLIKFPLRCFNLCLYLTSVRRQN